jgi:DNA integrity scanning protein DisA with diadenylate cyclase activity
VAYGQPHLPQPRIAQAKLRRDLEATFPGLSPAQADRLISLVRAASRQSHGALLVISARAEDEAQRLATQCTRVTPVRLTPELLLRLTAIDGAVLLNPRGICFAIGAILDGLATPHGDPSRGARYNSSVRYVAGQPQCLAVVVSEDGLVEWLTARDVEDRMPRR